MMIINVDCGGMMKWNDIRLWKKNYEMFDYIIIINNNNKHEDEDDDDDV
jgi:hypothetical protein